MNPDDNRIPVEPATAPPLARLDHLVLTVVSIEDTVRFYTRVLGMTEVVFEPGRRALAFGEQKLNLHQAGHEFDPKAAQPTPGSADLCFVTDADPARIAAWLRVCSVPLEQGPVTRTGALGPITSFYLRDPDGNLVELATYVEPQLFRLQGGAIRVERSLDVAEGRLIEPTSRAGRRNVPMPVALRDHLVARRLTADNRSLWPLFLLGADVQFHH